MRKFLLALYLLLTVASCGRYGDPLTPESYSPSEVRNLVVTADALAVNFKWSAPKKDQRGKELEQIDGYAIYRKQVDNFERLLDDDARFEKIGFVQDLHIQERDKLRAEARKVGKVARRIEVEPEKMDFVFADTTVKPGLNYIYKITPVSQIEVEGLVKSYVKLRFLGAASTVVIEENPSSPAILDNFFLKY